MFALFCGYINIFCSIEHIYFNQNYICSVKQKKMKNQYVIKENKYLRSKFETNKRTMINYRFNFINYQTYISLGKYAITRVKLSSAKFKDTLYGKTNCKYLNTRKKKLINYIQSMLIANYFYNIYE